MTHVRVTLLEKWWPRGVISSAEIDDILILFLVHPCVTKNVSYTDVDKYNLFLR